MYSIDKTTGKIVLPRGDIDGGSGSNLYTEWFLINGA